ECPALVVLCHYGDEPLVDESTHCGSDQALLVIQELVSVIEIDRAWQSALNSIEWREDEWDPPWDVRGKPGPGRAAAGPGAFPLSLPAPKGRLPPRPTPGPTGGALVRLVVFRI